MAQYQEYKKKYYRENIRLYKARYRELRERLLEIVSGAVCARCGFDDNRILQIDHIHNDAPMDRIRFGNTYNFYAYYIAHPDEARLKLQLLCPNCNWQKRLANDQSHKKWSNPPAASPFDKK